MKNRNLLRIFLLIFLVSSITPAYLNAQTKKEVLTATGMVLSEDSVPMQGIKVKAFASKDVTFTNQEGSFKIDIVAGTDHLVVEKEGYYTKVMPVADIVIKNKSVALPTIVLKKKYIFDDTKEVSLPFSSLEAKKVAASFQSISGEDLKSYPTTSFLDALSGLLPGVYVTTNTSMPGFESQTITIRGEAATIYIDGVIRDPSDLSPDEVESVEVLRDLSGRAMLGIYGSNPVIWITTKTGKAYERKTSFSAEYGMNMATAIPEYTNASDYATLYNEALVNDGYTAYYDQTALNAYANGSDPVHYPNIDYLDRYVRPSSPFRRANLNFNGGTKSVNYFSMLDYSGSQGLESTVGEIYKSDRFKVRSNVNITLNEYIKMNVNISGMYRKGRNPLSNIFNLNASIPANAHPIWFEDKLISNADYPVNIENAMVHGGYNESEYISTQNNAGLFVDLSEVTEGLSANLNVAFDASALLSGYEYESEALYWLVTGSQGQDSTVLNTEKTVSDAQATGDALISRKTVLNGKLDYSRTFDKHNINAVLAYYQAEFVRNSYAGYQPDKMQDFSLRLDYAFDDRYIVQLDQVYSGSMRLPKGDKFSWYPTIGLGWNIHNESFFKADFVDYLKLTGSYGIIGINSFSLPGYNSFYLYQTLWQQSGSWVSGISGSFNTPSSGYVIMQEGSDAYTLPESNYMNVGIQSTLFNHSLDIELNYYRNKVSNLISQKSSFTPSIVGGGQFLPATNYGENLYYGFDGLIQYTKSVGDFNISAGINALYKRGQYIVVDEPILEEDYRKYAGKEIDEYVLYNSEGLFQSEGEINDRTINQNFGALKPGDIIYSDYSGDGSIDEKDMYRTGDHSPRLFFGANLSLAYKGFRIKAVGQGAADGKISVLNDYFTAIGTNTNYSTALLNRWPVTNDFPRMTTSSENNIQTSTFWLRDATYFRIKNVELSYTFSDKDALALGLTNLKVFVRGSNIAQFSSLDEYGVDRENTGAGYDAYPIFKTFTGGLSLSF
ncbi:SusC/RagA family TonB-linked outer membrane protein [Saccharicrinis sp. FJH62]|uniref:SusC/RagA family TonB-linked outer membrane protein n=1 Tax=Saccharicrinis sp. FJH62 TaxID=3344657 RepID=UPI0035D5009E